jgi:hypothetical protein
MTVTATQIKIEGFCAFFRFLASVRSVRNQLRGSSGLVFVKFRGTRTLTGWENLAAMHAFRNSGAHPDAMRNLKEIGNAKSVTWEASDEPGWEEAIRRLDHIAF